jgi:hypothetical protein
MTDLPRLKAFGIEIAELEGTRKEIVENRRQLHLAEAQLPRLEADVERARGEDTQAAIKARRAGRKDPGARGEEKAQAELDRLRREIAVLQGVDHALTTEAQEILAKHAEEIADRLKATLTDLNHGQLAAISEVETARVQRLQLQSVLAQVSALAPPPEPQGAVGGYAEVLVHHGVESVCRVDEGQVQKVVAFLKAEAGDATERDQLAQQENPVADVFYAGTAGMAVPKGKILYQQRKAERAAAAADTTGG